MNFPRCSVKSPKADLGKGDITISFEVRAKDSMDTAQELAQYASENLGTVSLEIFCADAIPLRFQACTVKNPKADLTKGIVTIAFVVDESTMAVAKELAVYARENLGVVSVDVSPRQLPLKGMDSVSMVFKGAGTFVELRPGGLRADLGTGEIEKDGDDE